MRRILLLVVAMTTLAASCASSDDDTGTETTAEATSTSAAPVDGDSTGSDEPAPPATASAAVLLCEDVPIPTTSVIGTLPGNGNIPFELDGVILTYIEEHRDTYGIHYIDRERGGTIVLAFTDPPENHLDDLLSRRPQESDIAAIEPRPEITAEWTVAESGYAVDVVQADFTMAELESAAGDVWAILQDRDDVTLFGMGGGGNRFNRITLMLDRPTAEDLVLLAEIFGERAEMLCVEGPLWEASFEPPPQDDTLGLLDRVDDPLVLCSTPPFPLSLLDTDPDVDPMSDDPLIRALFDESMDGLPVPLDGWYTIARDDEFATFARFDRFDDTDFVQSHTFENTEAGWRITGLSAGECRLRLALPEGVSYMWLGLDPGIPVDPASTTLHLVVAQEACSGGESGVENMYPPEVRETDTEIVIAVAVIPPSGPQECPGNAGAPITIELERPIGDRAILDGIWADPRPLPIGID